MMLGASCALSQLSIRICILIQHYFSCLDWSCGLSSFRCLVPTVLRQQNMITNRGNLKIGWNKIAGQKVPMTSLKHEIIRIEHDSDEIGEDAPKKKTCRSTLSHVHSPSHGCTATEYNDIKQQQSGRDKNIYTPKSWLRDRTQIYYAPLYHPLHDAPPAESVPDIIPFPKKIG